MSQCDQLFCDNNIFNFEFNKQESKLKVTNSNTGKSVTIDLEFDYSVNEYKMCVCLKSSGTWLELLSA